MEIHNSHDKLCKTLLAGVLMWNTCMVSFDGGSACNVDDVTA